MRTAARPVGRLTAEAPLFVEDLLAATPRDVVIQLEVKAHADSALAGRTVDAPTERLRPDARAADRGAVVHGGGGGVRASGGARLPRAGCRVGRLRPAALVRWARRHGVGGVCVEHFVLSPPLIDALRRGGLSVTTGTLNEPALLDRVCRCAPMP